MKTPDFATQNKVLELRKKSKRGDRMFPDEIACCDKAFREYPEWYSSISKQVFDETKPFGAM